ncbi:hypothetical protein B5P43_28575 [Bacillus sp. SRB_336]|nr:hypothetical protein B5P43_28575 [Bacillus sp. SRB_336]
MNRPAPQAAPVAEPRRPRIISTRPTAAAAAHQGAPGGKPPHRGVPGDDPATAGSGAPAPEADSGAPASKAGSGGPASTARATNAKVSVAPVPDEDSAAKDRTSRTSRTAPEGPEASRPDGRAPLAGKPAGAKRSGTGRDRPASGAQQTGSAAAGGEGGARVLAFPEPAHKRRRRRVWLGAAGIAAVLAVVMALALFSPALAVKKVTFDGGRLIADKTLQTAVAPLIGRPLPQVTQGDVDALLAKVPQIKGSSIEARPPSTLLVHVVERVPVALLKVGPAWIQVDQDGVPLGKVADQSKVPLPLINGGTAAVGTPTFRAITAVLATLPKSVLGKLASASAKSPDAVELQMVDGKTVVWGNASDMELKAQVLDALVNAPAPVPADGAPPTPPVKVYDVSAPRHPVTR